MIHRELFLAIWLYYRETVRLKGVRSMEAKIHRRSIRRWIESGHLA